VVARARVGPAGWSAGVEELLDRIAGRFGRIECRRRVRGFLFGLLADLPRKNCWTIAEHAGEGTPDGMQHLLARAAWDTDGVGADLRAYVVDHLADPGAVLVIDETGDVKKGTHTVGVQRQYTGTAGRIEKAQVAVDLTYSAARGHALIDRELYLPRSWTDDPGRCAAAGVPAGVEFATKPALAIAGNRRLPTAAGPIRADVLAAALPRRAWQRLSAGPGAKGQRYYDWACLELPAPARCLDVRTQPRRGVDGQHGPAEHPRHRQPGQRRAQPVGVERPVIECVVERAVTAAVLRGQAQPDQRGHRSLGAQQRVGQLEQLIGPPGQASVQLTAETPQPVGRLRGQSLVRSLAQAKTVHHGHRGSLEARNSEGSRGGRPHARAGTTAVQFTAAHGLNDKLRGL
jgi:DDE superfamily endonuclease